MDQYDYLWQIQLFAEELEDKIESFFDENDLVLFFVKNKRIYGTNEESRVTFAKIKKPDSDVSKSWLKDASFSAIDLIDATKGKLSKIYFNRKDIKHIKVIDSDEAIRRIIKKVKKSKMNNINN